MPREGYEPKKPERQYRKGKFSVSIWAARDGDGMRSVAVQKSINVDGTWVRQAIKTDFESLSDLFDVIGEALTKP